MNIDEQIKKLQRVKEKINLYTKLQENLSNEATFDSQEHKALEVEHYGLLAEFIDEVTVFCQTQIDQLSGIQPKATKVTMDKVANPDKDITKSPQKTKQEELVQDVFADVPQDPIRFAMKFRSYEGKKVTVKTNGGTVEGIVRGVNAPNLVVETDTGYTVQVHPTDLGLLEV